MWPLAVYNELAALTGFSFERKYGRFAGKQILAEITRFP